MDFEIRKASAEDAEQVHALYTSRIGTKGCTWDEGYPTLELVKHDIQRSALYAVYDGERIAAAAVCGEDRDLRRFDLWSGEIKNPCELERVGILEEYQGKHIASRLLRHIEADMISQGYDGILLLVDPENDRAKALYEHLGFSRKGEREGWENIWSCYEKQLTDDGQCDKISKKVKEDNAMKYEEIVAKVKEMCGSAQLKGYDKHFVAEIEIKGEGEGVFYIEAKDGKINVEPYDYHDRNVRLIASADNFLKLASGKLDPVAAFLSGKLKVEGGTENALEFKKILDAIG